MRLRWSVGVSNLQWLTPNSAPNGTKTIKLVVPNQFELEAAIRGALVPLFYSESWGQSGSVSIEDTLHYLEDTVYQTLVEWADCTEGTAHVVGEVFALAHNNIPDGALLADGSEVSQALYPALYAALGTTWGTAAEGYFKLPPLSARMLVGAGQIPGGSLHILADDGGEEWQDVPQAASDIHHHTVPMSSVSIFTPAFGTAINVLRPTGTTNTSDSGEGLQALWNMPPYVVINWCIWAE